MRPVTPEFLTLLRLSHSVVVEATLEVPGEEPVEVPVIGGEITLDGTSPGRRRGSLIVPWSIADYGPAGIDLRTLPFGSYAVLKRGIRLGSGTRELVTLGRLRVDAVSSRATEGAASLELSDRMAQIADEPLLTPYTPTGKASDAIVHLVNDVFGSSIAYHVLTVPASEPTLVDVTYNDDRVKAISDLAATINAEAYFDAEGDLVVAPRAPTDPTPVWDVNAGLDGVLVDVDESLDRTETANGVLVTGQASADTAPISALVMDTDPTSPTFWGGTFGKVALVIQSSAVQTVGQATAQANAELGRRLALTRNVTLTTVPNPALEPGDVIRVTFTDGRVEDHLVEALTVPLDAEAAIGLGSRALDPPTMFRSLTGRAARQELVA